MKYGCRALATPGRGCTISRQLAATSAAVSGEPSCHFTPSRIVNVQVLPSSVGFGISVQRSQTKSSVEDGFIGLIRISTLYNGAVASRWHKSSPYVRRAKAARPPGS
jgi:hypothetical protein